MKCPNDCGDSECPYNSDNVRIAEAVAECMAVFSRRGMSTFEGITTLFLATRMTIENILQMGFPDTEAYLESAENLSAEIYDDIAALDEETEEEAEPSPNETDPRLN
jgi:hypothetical protein